MEKIWRNLVEIVENIASQFKLFDTGKQVFLAPSSYPCRKRFLDILFEKSCGLTVGETETMVYSSVHCQKALMHAFNINFTYILTAFHYHRRKYPGRRCRDGLEGMVRRWSGR